MEEVILMDKNKQLIQKSGAVESQELTDEELENGFATLPKIPGVQ